MLEIDFRAFSFERVGDHEWQVCYRRLPVLRQRFDDPTCELTRQRGIAAAVSLLEFRWSRMSAHERIQLLAVLREMEDADRF